MTAAKKLFGDFLVERGMIGNDQLLAILVDQMRQQPSVAEIVFDESLLPAEQQLSILRLQNQNGWDYQRCCAHLGIWTHDLLQKIRSFTEKRRKPLGQLILAKTELKFQDLTKALDEFLSTLQASTEMPENTKEVGTVSQPQEKVAVPSPVSSSVAPKSSPVVPIESSDGSDIQVNFSMIDPALLYELMDIFSDEKRTEIEVEVMSWEDKSKLEDTTILTQGVRGVFREVHTIKGASRFVRAELAEKLIHALEELLAKCVDAQTLIHTIGVTTLADVCIKTIDCVWRIREVIRTEKSEKKFWESKEHRESYVGMLKNIQSVMASRSKSEEV